MNLALVPLPSHPAAAPRRQHGPVLSRWLLAPVLVLAAAWPLAPAQAQTSALPYALRQAAERFPVTLYSTTNCEACTTARELLRQRGVPYSERTVTTAEDSDALQRVSGGREAPTLTIGQQVLRGLTASTWSDYLDAAGYPKTSALPPNYQPPPVAPLVPRSTATTSSPAGTGGSSGSPPPQAPPAGTGGIRF